MNFKDKQQKQTFKSDNRLIVNGWYMLVNVIDDDDKNSWEGRALYKPFLEPWRRTNNSGLAWAAPTKPWQPIWAVSATMGPCYM